MTPPRRPFAEFSATVDALVAETERQSAEFSRPPRPDTLNNPEENNSHA